jgi:HEAT repeat protein
MRKKRTTAEEFAGRLKEDPGYRAKLEQQAQGATRLREAEAELLKRLSSKGYRAASMDELVRQHAPLPRDLADALLECLGRVSETNLQEAIVRALGATREEFDAGQLTDLFERTDSSTLQWAIANTLAEARPASLGDWLIRALQNQRYGKAREMLALAAARTNPPEVVNPVLIHLLDELPGHAALALAETGAHRELEALRVAHRSATGWERDQIGRTIDLIARRDEERA